MSGLKKDNTTFPEWRILFSEEKVRIAFFIFSLCILPFVFRFWYQPDITILIPFIFICFEFALVLSLEMMYLKEEVLRQYRYIIYTAVGLPCTVFMALTDEFHLSGALRFLMILLFLSSFSERKRVILHIYLFFSGFFFYAFLKTGKYFFSNTNIWEIAISYLILALVVLYLDKKTKYFTKKLLRKVKQKRSVRTQTQG